MVVITKDFDISEQNATTPDKEGESGRGGGRGREEVAKEQ